MQTLLLAGVATWLVFDLGVRLTARLSVGLVAAALYAADADLQQFGSTILTEALTVFLSVWALWLRVHDGRWCRAAWLLALLALVRPNFAAFPFAFALVDGVRMRRPHIALEVAWPTVAVFGLWWGISLVSGADALRPYKWFVSMHTFGTVYEANLWQKLPEYSGPKVL